MKKKIIHPYLLLFFCSFGKSTMFGRSIHRPKKNDCPCIITKWKGENSPTFSLNSSHLEEYALFRTFNKQFFFENLFPDSVLSNQKDNLKSVTGKHIKKLIDNLIQEVLQKKVIFTDFIVLRKSNFNTKKCSGLIILKCKHQPFVVKLFIETPETFVKYETKGIVPRFFFYLSGGANRHLIGFTRVKNLQDMKAKIESDSYWSTQVMFPRKWFYLPEDSKWIEITGKNIGTKNKQSISIPGTYCIIADWIETGRKKTIFNKNDRKTCMQLCNFLGMAIDPHIDNFVTEKKTGKIAIIDTEHFLTLVGLKKKTNFSGYTSWITHLAGNCAKALFFRTKKERKAIHIAKSKSELTYNKKETNNNRT